MFPVLGLGPPNPVGGMKILKYLMHLQNKNDSGIYTALAAQQEALAYQAFVAQEYVGRVAIPETLQERGRYAEHASIADSFLPVQRKPTIVIGSSSNSRI